MRNQQHTPIKQTIIDKDYDLRDLQHAIAPFEEVLIAHLPSKEAVLARCKQRKLKKNLSQAMLLCGLIAGGLYWLDPVYQTENYSAGLGERKQISLDDGSQLHLNSNSQISLRYGLRTRQLQLRHGEASFVVQHVTYAWQKPFERHFLVNVDDVQIEDIGTKFNVRKYHRAHSVVSVLEGQVRVSPLNSNSLDSLDLLTGQSAEYKNGKLMLRKVSDIQADIAWQRGYIQFKDTSLAEALAELQRYQTLHLDFSDPAAQHIKISGRFDSNDAELFLQLLPQIAAVDVRKTDAGVWQLQSRAQQ